MKITFCQYNEQSFELIRLLREDYPEFEVSITRCIFCCGECSELPIARIKGNLFIGNDCKDLLNKIQTYVNDQD